MVSFNYWLDDEFEVITLKEGEMKHFTVGGPNEEGYSYTYTTFGHMGDHVEMQVTTRARDCDGSIETYGEYTCPLTELASWETPDGVMTPNWEKVEESQRDHSAEAMGY